MLQESRCRLKSKCFIEMRIAAIGMHCANECYRLIEKDYMKRGEGDTYLYVA
jgi:hypothetical protein